MGDDLCPACDRQIQPKQSTVSVPVQQEPQKQKKGLVNGSGWLRHLKKRTVVDQGPIPLLEKTKNSRSPDIQEINEDIRQIYHIQNCGAVYMPVDSFNARGVRMENCGNNVPQVTYHRPRIIGDEKFIHSQSHTVSNVPQNAMSPPTAPPEIAKDKPNDVHQLETNAPGLSPPQSPQPISPSHFSGDHNVKYLEQLLDSSLATAAVIQFSGSTLADVLTPRAYDTFKALYALAALDAAASSTKPRGSEISICSDIGNDCPLSSSPSPPLPNSSLAVPRNGRIHISIPVDYVMLFLYVGLVAVSFLVVFFNLPPLCERDVGVLF